MNTAINLKSLKPISHTIPAVSTSLDMKSRIGNIRVRLGINRDNYQVQPGLYKVGNPTGDSDVFVSANYKLSFDILRKNLSGMNAWIMVIDTKGVNVWCAAGKKTFGTDNIIRSIQTTSLESIVRHKKIILPQLAAPGVAAHTVREQTGFRVIYGPVRANDINQFIRNGYKATAEMRRINFSLSDRAKLIPVDFFQGKYKLLIVMASLFFLSGLDRDGFLFSKMLSTSVYPLMYIVTAYLAGVVITPLMLPWVPFRAFSLKGAFWGSLTSLFLFLIYPVPVWEAISMVLASVSVASFTAMNFTGSSTFTSLSGVKKEMKWSVPFQIAFAAIGLIIFLLTKLF